jgi:hypothetical protein
MMITTSETSPLFDTMSCQLPGGIEPYVPVAAEIDVPFDEKLVDLAERIRERIQRLNHAMRTAVGRMRSIGEMLLEAKRICGQHGRWKPFLQDCGIHERYAQECMKFARRWPEIEAKTNSCSDLTLEEVRRILRTQPPKALEHNSEERASNAAVREKKKSAALTNRSEPRRDHQAHLEIEEPPVPEPAPHDPADEQQDPQGASAASVQNTDDDASWLKSLPLRAQLANTTSFDEEARLWKRTRPLMDTLRDILSPGAVEVGRGATPSMAKKGYRLRVLFATHVRPPDKWKLCDGCKGKLTDRTGRLSCLPCDGHGFFVTHEGDYEEAES